MNFVIHFVEFFNLSIVFAIALTWKKLSPNLKWVAIYFLLLPPLLILKYLIGYYFQMPNRFVAHLFLHAEFILFNLFFYTTLNSLIWKKAIKIFALGFIVFTIVDYIFLESFINDTPDYLTIILSSWIVIFSHSAYSEIHTEEKIIDLSISPVFWFFTGFFFLHFTSLFINATRNFWSYDELRLYFYLFHYIIWFLYTLMILNGFRRVHLNSKTIKNQ